MFAQSLKPSIHHLLMVDTNQFLSFDLILNIGNDECLPYRKTNSSFSSEMVNSAMFFTFQTLFHMWAKINTFF